MRARLWVIGLPVAVIMALVAVQLRWVNRLREADVAHMRLVAGQRAEGLAQEFDREIGRAYDLFNTEPSSLRNDEWKDFLVEYEAWAAKAAQPGLFRAWYVVHDDRRGGLVLQRFDPVRRQFPKVPWSDELRSIRAAIEGENKVRVPGALPVGEPRVGPEWDTPPALLIPLFASEAAVRSGYGPAYGYVIGIFDLDYVRSTFLPSLARKYFGDSAGLEYDIEVVQAHAPSLLIFRSSDAHRDHADVGVGMFRIGFAHLDEVFLAGRDVPQHEGIWRLAATHRDGSIEAHVARERRPDLAVGLGVMGLLLASVGLLIASARSARRLASQQTAFVAGVSHELRTPLAVIRSAAENLADGLVAEPERVRRYGELIAKEGRRLSHLVEQAIDFAALEAGARLPPEEIYDVASLIDEIAVGCDAPLTRRIAAELPSLKGDPSATKQVISNLLENARKHAPASPIAIHIDAIDMRGKPAVRIEIADKGAGIAADDLPHLFEPFYRGGRAREGQIPGSGLGLSVVKRLVEKQGGTISVRSYPGSGAMFIVCLPGA
jgi:signal transduction histidine kinase